jgi:NNP family nitrate/nitrite transporter-like MFS transporter
MAAVFKHIPVYFPDHVGSVGGLVGMVGGLGGFVLPILFGLMNDIIGIWTSCFMLLFVLVSISLTWMHISITYSDRKRCPQLRDHRALPETLYRIGELKLEDTKPHYSNDSEHRKKD